MKILFYTDVKDNRRGVEEYVERRLQFAISRFETRIDSVRIKLSDVNGPRGGVDQRCVVVLKLRLGKELFVESMENTWEAAADVAADRMGRMISRTLKKCHSKRQSNPIFLKR